MFTAASGSSSAFRSGPLIPLYGMIRATASLFGKHSNTTGPARPPFGNQAGDMSNLPRLEPSQGGSGDVCGIAATFSGSLFDTAAWNVDTEARRAAIRGAHGGSSLNARSSYYARQEFSGGNLSGPHSIERFTSQHIVGWFINLMSASLIGHESQAPLCFCLRCLWFRLGVGHASLRSRSPRMRRCKHWSEWFGEPCFWARFETGAGDIIGFIQTIVHARTILLGSKATLVTNVIGRRPPSPIGILIHRSTCDA